MPPDSPQPTPANDDYQRMLERQCFQHSKTQIGAGSAGHWVRMAGILSPLIIGEIVKDSDKRWRWIRISSLATALVSEGFYQYREKQRQEQRAHERCHR
jgi:hypothetical protein